MTEKYEVNVGMTKTFEATSEEDAKQQFIDWLGKNKSLIDVRKKR